MTRSNGVLVGAAAVVAIVCCAFPFLVAGAFAGAAGIGLGSWLLVAIGLAVVAIGVSRRRRRRACRVPDHDAESRSSGV